MAICSVCNQEMSDGLGCTLAAFDDIDEGVLYPRMRYGDEPFLQEYDPEYPLPQLCGDCATPIGKFHHPGCDIKRCPKCGRQAISCGCTSDGDDYELDDDMSYEWVEA